MSFFSDVFTGNFAKAWHDLQSGYARMPKWMQTLVHDVGTDGYILMGNLAPAIVQTLVTKGINNANCVEAAKTLFGQVKEKAPNLVLQDAFVAINGALKDHLSTAVQSIVTDKPAG